MADEGGDERAAVPGRGGCDGAPGCRGGVARRWPMCVARLALLLLLAPSRCGLVRIRSASAVGALGPHHLGGVFLVENLVAVAAFKCLLDHGGLLFRRGMRFGRAAVRASCPLHGKARLIFLENEERPDRRDGEWFGGRCGGWLGSGYDLALSMTLLRL